MNFLEALNTFNDYLWYIPFVLIVLLGLYALIRLKGVQFTQFKEACKVTFSAEKNKKGSVSSFHVFCVSMGNRIGIGNIAGPVTAILVGGPGAIFWMWIFALLGMGTSFLETTVGQIYKSRNADGGYHGGPAYNIAKGLNLKKAGLAVAFIMVLMYILGFISMEVSSISEALCEAFVFDNNAMIFAVALTILTALIVVGGFKRIANVSTIVVPLMAIGWLIICIVSICISGGIGNAFVMIFQCAFNVPAAVGGGIGAMLLIGMKRGILSNEAGVGTITNISSIADVDHPAQQGLSQSLGVLIDTIVSTLTALVVLSAFANYDQIKALDLDSMPLLQQVFEGTLGSIAPALVAIFVFVFAITCLMADYVIGDNNLKFITDKKIAWIIMCIVLLAMVFLSSFYASDEMFAIVDIFLAICGIINCIVMFKIGGRAVEAYKDYRRQKAEGIETPEFHKSALSDQTGVTEWKD